MAAVFYAGVGSGLSTTLVSHARGSRTTVIFTSASVSFSIRASETSKTRTSA
jgi:hypothetical protein